MTPHLDLDVADRSVSDPWKFDTSPSFFLLILLVVPHNSDTRRTHCVQVLFLPGDRVVLSYC